MSEELEKDDKKLTPEIKNRIRQYNEDLKTAQSEAADIRANINFGTNELTKQCKELSILLNMEVTEDNLEQIYKQEMDKILNDLTVGENILTRIRNNEADEISSVEGQEALNEIASSSQGLSVERATIQSSVPNSNSDEINKNVEKAEKSESTAGSSILDQISGSNILDI